MVCYSIWINSVHNVGTKSVIVFDSTSTITVPALLTLLIPNTTCIVLHILICYVKYLSVMHDLRYWILQAS